MDEGGSGNKKEKKKKTRLAAAAAAGNDKARGRLRSGRLFTRDKRGYYKTEKELAAAHPTVFSMVPSLGLMGEFSLHPLD